MVASNETDETSVIESVHDVEQIIQLATRQFPLGNVSNSTLASSHSGRKTSGSIANDDLDLEYSSPLESDDSKEEYFAWPACKRSASVS